MLEHGVGIFPFITGKVVDHEFHFDVQFSLGVEVSPGIAADRFDEVVDALGKIRGFNMFAYLGRIIHELEVLVGSFLQMLDPGGVVLP